MLKDWQADPQKLPCRSLRQLRKEVAAKLAQTAAAKVQAFTVPAAPPSVPAGLYESQSDTDMSPGPCSQAHKEYTEVIY